MTALLVASLAGLGCHLLVTGLLGTQTEQGRAPALADVRRRLGEWQAQAGLGDLPTRRLAATVAAAALAGFALGALVFGALLPAAAVAGFAGSMPPAGWRHRRRARLAAAQESWPRLIDEVRVLTGAGGRSVPQALFEAAERAPAELRPAFAEARRTWLLTTDLERTFAVVKDHLADPTADAACETLLVAHELGGSDLDGRLAALAEDRRLDTRCRKEARARQAGVRFARRFVLVVPLGMAAAGLTVGNGRSAYASPGGQVAVVVALGLVMACWWWSGRILRLPTERRVLTR
jgi:tight adherence protein B